MFCKVVGEVGPVPGWSQKCTRTAGGELLKISIISFLNARVFRKSTSQNPRKAYEKPMCVSDSRRKSTLER